VTQELFTRYRTPEDFAHIPRRVLEREIHSTGFFRMKAGNIIGCARAILERYKGEVPAKMAELVSLPVWDEKPPTSFSQKPSASARNRR